MLSNRKIDSVGVYIGSHDPTANDKKFSLSLQEDDTSGTQVAQYEIFVVAPNANEGFNSHQPEWPIVISVYRGDWYDASQIYRNWVLPNAEWTKQGPMKLRDDVPDWVYDITTWINSNW